jgi:hypothetical protein
VPTVAWKQPNAGLAPQAAPVVPQGFEQFRAEHDVPILATFTALNMDHHALAIDVGNLQMCQLGAADAGRIKRHQQDAIKRRARRVDQLGHFLRAEDGGQAQHLLGIRRLFGAPRLLERFDEEEPQRAKSLGNAVGRQFPLSEQIRLVLTDVIGAELIRTTIEVACEILYGSKIRKRKVSGE